MVVFVMTVVFINYRKILKLKDKMRHGPPFHFNSFAEFLPKRTRQAWKICAVRFLQVRKYLLLNHLRNVYLTFANYDFNQRLKEIQGSKDRNLL